MRLLQDSIDGIRFYHRPGFSDLKAFEEVVGRKVYLKHGLKILPGEKWMDCGGNVGAFTLLACSLGAEVTVYEPDPFNADMIERNLRLNGYSATIKQAALVHDDRESTILHIGNSNQVWRNSIVTKWNEKGIRVPCLNFDHEARPFDCCKMDIEGAEMPILENTAAIFKKLVYEWSFDVDPSLPRIRRVIERQQQLYKVKVRANCLPGAKGSVWKSSWFPLCTDVTCLAK
jgi:FkbM family methyltransferase